MTEERTLAEAQQEVRDGAEDGTRCPCCGQLVQLYRRGIHAGMARALIVAWRLHRRDFFHTNTLGLPGGDFQKLGYWGLIERASRDRDPDAPGVGMWRITDHGEAFVRCAVKVPSHALVLQGEVVRLVSRRGEVSIRDALGTRFDYDELMGDD